MGFIGPSIKVCSLATLVQLVPATDELQRLIPAPGA